MTYLYDGTVFDLSIPNSERALLGMPLICRITVCCVKDQVPGGCANLQGKLAFLIKKYQDPIRTDHAVWHYSVVVPKTDSAISVSEIEILP